MDDTKQSKTGAPKRQFVGAFDLFPKSVEAVKRNLNLFLILYALPFLTVLVSYAKHHHGIGTSTANVTGLSDFAFSGIIVFGVIVAIIVFLAMLFIKVMLIKLQLEAAKGATPTFEQLWPVAKKFFLRLIGLEILVGLLVIGGLILFIIPGIIMLRRYFLAAYFMIDQDLKIKDAMAKSAAATKPFPMAVWSVIGVSILLSLAGIVPIIGPIVAFGLAIAYSVAPAFRYLELNQSQSAANS